MASEPTTRRDLFGGAISADLPSRYVDVSDFRPIPDNQEVWADASRDESVVVEILERQPEAGASGGRCAAEWFFRDLCVEVDARVETGDAAVLRAYPLDDPAALAGLRVDERATTGAVSASACVGRQSVAKSRDAARNDVEVALVCIRLDAHRTDVLVTVNRALAIAPGSSAVAPDAGKPGVPDAEATARAVAKTFRVVDWNLFAG
jgi:hypothetical protein